jgi:hypothetical protein
MLYIDNTTFIFRKNILATDLALYFGNQKFVSGLLEKDQFNIDNPEHRDALFAMMMTGADLCAVPKPWRTMDKTIDYLYDEFWMQVNYLSYKSVNVEILLQLLIFICSSQKY